MENKIPSESSIYQEKFQSNSKVHLSPSKKPTNDAPLAPTNIQKQKKNSNINKHMQQVVFL
jgi:hypothetical protein